MQQLTADRETTSQAGGPVRVAVGALIFERFHAEDPVAAPVPAIACQISGSLPFLVTASWTCRAPFCPVMTIQSRLTTRDGAWLNVMDDSHPLNAYAAPIDDTTIRPQCRRPTASDP